MAGQTACFGAWRGASHRRMAALYRCRCAFRARRAAPRRAPGARTPAGTTSLLLTGFDMRGFWEIIDAYLFQLGFLLGNAPWLAANPRSRRYVGIGAFQLVRREAYDACGGHRALAMEVVEDMKLGKLIKEAGFRSGLGIATESVWLRWYSGAGNIVRGLTKNMFAAMTFSCRWRCFISRRFSWRALRHSWVWRSRRAGRACLQDFAVAVVLTFHAGACKRDKVSLWYAFTRPAGLAYPVLYRGALDAGHAAARRRRVAGHILSFGRIAARVGVGYSKIGASLASTSYTTASGTLSSFLPPRAPRSSARG